MEMRQHSVYQFVTACNVQDPVVLAEMSGFDLSPVWLHAILSQSQARSRAST